jgi:hypothetical protein
MLFKNKGRLDDFMSKNESGVSRFCFLDLANGISAGK